MTTTLTDSSSSTSNSNVPPLLALSNSGITSVRSPSSSRASFEFLSFRTTRRSLGLTSRYSFCWRLRCCGSRVFLRRCFRDGNSLSTSLDTANEVTWRNVSRQRTRILICVVLMGSMLRRRTVSSFKLIS